MARVVTDRQTHINDNSISFKVNMIVYNAVYMYKEHETLHLHRENNMIMYSKQQKLTEGISITEQDCLKC